MYSLGNNYYSPWQTEGTYRLNEGNTEVGSVLTDGSWHHISFVVGSVSTAYPNAVYIDGVNSQYNIPTGFPFPSNTAFPKAYLNYAWWASEQQFQGSMDDFRVYTRALSASEISSIYQPPITCPAGSFNPGNAAAQSSCLCSAGFFGSNGVCTACPSGKTSTPQAAAGTANFCYPPTPPKAITGYVTKGTYRTPDCTGAPSFVDTEFWGQCLMDTSGTTLLGTSSRSDISDGVNRIIYNYAGNACAGAVTSVGSEPLINRLKNDQGVSQAFGTCYASGPGYYKGAFSTTLPPAFPGKVTNFYATQADCYARTKPTARYILSLPTSPSCSFNPFLDKRLKMTCSKARGFSVKQYLAADTTCSGAGSAFTDTLSPVFSPVSCAAAVQNPGNGDNLHFWGQDTCTSVTPMVVDSGTWAYSLYHSGSGCKSAPHEYVVEQLQLNLCAPPDASSPSFHKFLCKEGDVKNTLSRTDYSDSSCATPRGPSSIVAHNAVCHEDTRTGAYVETVCGDFSSSLVKSKAQILVKWFPTSALSPTGLEPPTCFANQKTRAILLNKCRPQPNKGGRRGVAYFYVLSLVAQDASTISLSMRRFAKTDQRCQGAATLSTSVVYSKPSNPATACSRDPVSPHLGAYTAAVYHDGSAASWTTNVLPFLVDNFAPTSRPTRLPTRLPTRQPTGQPSTQPTGLPTEQPTGQPTIKPPTTAG